MIATFGQSATLPVPGLHELYHHQDIVSAASAHPDTFSGSCTVRKWDWKNVVANNFAAVSELGPGWDGPQSKSISRYTIYQADVLLRDALASVANAKPPYIVPRADGALQIEWASEKFEAEFALQENGARSFWLRNRETGIEIEDEGDGATELLFRWARRIASEVGNAADVSPPKAVEQFLFAA